MLRRRLSRARAGTATAAAVSLLLVAVPSLALAVTPINGPTLTIFPVAINTGPGDQYDPHVSGDLVSYTSDSTIRYYSFSAGTDLAVPTLPGSSDYLSDVSGSRIGFSRLDPTGLRIMVFDTTSAAAPTPVAPQAGFPMQSSAGMGGSTVAFVDENTWELMAADVAGGGFEQVASSTAFESMPQMSPAGDLIVFESCSTDCDIHQAAKPGASWVVTALTSTADTESNPDTDGSVVVYDSTRAGERDIYWQPVGGGTEQRLELSGEQRNPSVSDGVILFESVAPGEGAADVFAYEIATGRLFRITTTAADDTLNDISALGGGAFHAVWATGAAGSRDLIGATFTIPPVAPPPPPSTTVSYAAVGAEYFATTTQGRFAGLAATPGDIGAWVAVVNHTPITGGTATINAGGSFTYKGRGSDITGSFTGGSLTQTSGFTGCGRQIFEVVGGMALAGPSGTGSFAMTLTHLRRSILGQCVTYAATVQGTFEITTP